MISTLTIQNYALIDRLEMQPSDKLNIITGETGAGKSIMLGAVGLLLGNRSDSKVLLHNDKKCIVEGTNSDVLAAVRGRRREVTKHGREMVGLLQLGGTGRVVVQRRGSSV